MELFIKIFVMLLLLLFLCIFTGGETALLCLSILHVDEKIKSKGKISKFYQEWLNNPNKIITNILTWTNLLCIAIGVISVSIAVDISKMTRIELSLLLIVSTISVTTLILFLGEILPKLTAEFSPVKFSSFASPVINLTSSLTNWMTNFFMSISERIIKWLFKEVSYKPLLLNTTDLKILLEEEKKITQEHKKIIRDIIEFGEKKVSAIMTPKANVYSLDVDLGISNILKKVKETKYSRIPIYKREQENIIGILHIKDLLSVISNPELITIEDILHPVYFVPENACVYALLKEFKTGRQHMAVVVDEYGSFLGVITIEDIVEELVGEIYDEYDVIKETISIVSPNEYIIDANEEIEVVNEKLNLSINTKAKTIGGFVLQLKGMIPKIGERINSNNLTIEIIDTDKRKINKVKLIKLS